ncbi:MAG: class I SAM-dependent methyltransferase [Bacteroidetes bacterium]|nr:class I SAM-dependent methyltransferase [Bacteroidota bacterium]MBU1578947.1 class I SAM-dependent methyltransferase [Bacteroidota bacterium]
MEPIKPIAMPGTHQRFLKYFNSFNHSKSLKILDIGAGHGAFTKVLNEKGFDVSACDLFPEIFMYDSIPCKKADITKELPYPDNAFDLAIAIEVSEHIIDHEQFFNEINRILKPQGLLYLSTPNILSLKSRLRFLFNGFFYSFGQLDLNNNDGLQHVASLTLDQYNYVALRNGFRKACYEIDKKQKTSTWLLIFLFPFIWVNTKAKKSPIMHNTHKLLLGRLLFLSFQNRKAHEPRAEG